MKRFVSACAAGLLLLTATHAHADTAPVDVEHFRPNIDGRGIFGVESADAHEPGQFNLGLFLHYAKSQLRFFVNNVEGPEVRNRFTFNLLGAVGITRWLELGLALPVSIWNEVATQVTNPTSQPGLGTLRIVPKFRLLREGDHGIGLAILTAFGIPTGARDYFLGNQTLAFSPSLALEKGVGPVRFLLNVGANIRGSEDGWLNVRPGNELTLGFGVGWRVHQKVELGLEYAAVVPMGTETRDVLGSPMELLIGARILPTPKWQIWVGAGPGLNDGYGSPTVRVFGGVGYGPYDRDTDGDGVPDRLDRCPKVAGQISNRGCPAEAPPPPEKDTDGDGVPDHLDSCPRDAGPRDNGGCPVPPPKQHAVKPQPPQDTDGDHVPDTTDRCPNVPGPEANHGCPWPDRDKDGTPDKDDHCPDVAGPHENHGCPVVVDRDKDGTPDKDDKCPDQAGPKENKGCPWPDRDADGVPDKDDDCPLQAGPSSNKGCPEKAKVLIKKGEVKILQRVNFAKNSAVILRRSYRLLNEVADVLTQFKQLARVEVQGHTDDTGRLVKNMRLSRQRAASVKRYLVKKGVEAKRLVTRGYGPRKPLVRVRKSWPKAKLNRARIQNRRVQFVILENTDNAPGAEAPAREEAAAPDGAAEQAGEDGE